MYSELDKVDELCKLYSLELLEETDNIRVYLYNSGYFSNIEIIYVDLNDAVEQTSKKYLSMGYAVRKKKFLNIEKLRNELFNGFFDVKRTKMREKNEYKNYCKLLTKKLQSEYTYICGDYVVNGETKNGSVIEFIDEELCKEGPQMIILEASAGFGKTCTSFELYNNLASKDNNKITILAELSKNRNATVFRYVLLSEINRSFSKLSAELVTDEIRNGNIILIIDGFDELLYVNSYINDCEKESSEKSQTMLETIGELFSGKTQSKVILTARKSSIFTGELFDNWVEKCLSSCEICRIQIDAPSVNKWLDKEKISIFNNNNINIELISNPVLLAFLKNMSIEDIEDKFCSIDDIVDCYFNILLERERERQSLLLSVDEQRDIMQNLAIQFVNFNISEDTADFIKEIIKDIIGQARLNEYLIRYDETKYNIEEKPTEDQFLDRLSHHALLDRVSLNKNLIGFINSFIFGLFIGMAICENKIETKDIDFKFLDFAATAYEIKKTSERRLLLDKIKATDSLKPEILFYLDFKLVQQMESNYSGIIIDGVKFTEHYKFSEKYIFENCTFSECIFENCIIYATAFKTTQFYNCRFYNIKVIGKTTDEQEIIFCACEGFQELLKKDNTNDVPNIDFDDYRKPILEQFWKSGSDSAELYRNYTTLFKGFMQSERKNIEKSINRLISERILLQQLHCLKLNMKKIDQIKEILGR